MINIKELEELPEKIEKILPLLEKLEKIEKFFPLLEKLSALQISDDKEDGKQENEQTGTILTVEYFDKKNAENKRELKEKINKIDCRIKDIERDQRTDASIASAVRSMGMFEKTPQSVNGSFFTEELNDYYG